MVRNKKVWDKNIKEKVKLLRKEGYSYGQLTEVTGAAKSTLFSWLKGIERPKRFAKYSASEWARKIQPLAVKMLKKKRQERIKQIISLAQKEVGKLKIEKDFKKAILSILYWAEGNKEGGVHFANIDPRIVFLFVSLLRECYEVDESKFRIRLHLHYYHREREIKTFWSNLLKIPLSQFNKTYRKHRSKEKTFRRNFGGICFVKYNSVCLREQILQYAYFLAESIIGKVNVPVA